MSAVTDVRVAIVGAGFAGVGMAIRLRQAGEHDFVVLERNPDVGGTWHANTYPGCACDIPAHLYSFSFAPNPDWSRWYARQPEIEAYLRRVVDQHGVRPHIRFGVDVADASWSDAEQRWTVACADGAVVRAQVLVAAAGPLSQPKVPELPGLEAFPGPAFHTAEWDHEADLRGKRVAVIGTGASAIQVIPQLQPLVGQLSVFQRTPPWVLPQADRRTTRAERALFRRVPATQKAVRGVTYGIQEVFGTGLNHPRLLEPIQRVAERWLASQVRDPELRRVLTPSYRVGCKRTLVSNGYYRALSQPNVRVVDQGVVGVEGSTVVGADGARAEVDAIVLGTGFHVTDPPVAALIGGRDGRRLSDVWGAEGMQAHHGTTVAGFPNLYFLVGPNTGLGHNSIVYMIESQLEYVMQALEVLGRPGVGALDVRRMAQDAFNAEVQRELDGTVWNAGGCASWYLDAYGNNRTLWPGPTWRFRRQLTTFDAGEYDLAPAVSRAREPETVSA